MKNKISIKNIVVATTTLSSAMFMALAFSAISIKSEVESLTVMNIQTLKSELDAYYNNNKSTISGDEVLYSRIKQNHERFADNNCKSITVDNSKVCSSIVKMKAEYKLIYDLYNTAALSTLNVYYKDKIEKDFIFSELKADAAEYLSYKALNENFNDKAYSIVFANKG